MGGDGAYIMSRWNFSNDLEDQLQHFLSRVVRGQREKTPGEAMVLEALKPRGGEVGCVCFFAAIGGWILYASPLDHHGYAICMSFGLWMCIRHGRHMCRAARRSLLGWGLLLSGVSALGMDYFSPQMNHLGTDSVVEDWATLVEVEGIVLENPTSHPPITIGLDRFRYSGDSKYSQLRIRSLRTQDDFYDHLNVVLPIRCDWQAVALGGGDEIRVRGRLEQIVPPMNPGTRYTKTTQPEWKFVITDPRLIRQIDAEHSWEACWIRMRSSIRDRFYHAVDTLSGDDSRNRAFLYMLFLGHSVEGHDELRDTFSKSGLSHVLAISGLHLAVVALSIRIVCTACTSNIRISAVITLAILILYAVILEPRSSIHRSVLMIGMVLVGHASARYWRSDRIFSVAFYLVLTVFPGVGSEAGFQLTFAVTAGLIMLSPACRMRWFGMPDRLGRSRRSIVVSRICDGVTTSSVAWLVGFPLVLYHFGRIAPAGIPAAIMESIPVFVALIIGFPLMLFAAVFGISDAPGHRVLSLVVDCVFGIADMCAYYIPTWSTPLPSTLWVAVILGSCVCAVKCPNIRWRRIAWGGVLILSIIPCVGRVLPNARVPFSMHSLAVGNGSAILIRSETTAILYDAGSTTYSSVGRRIIVPALQSLGIRQLDACVISHMNLDHVSGIGAVLDSFDVSTVIVSHHLNHHARTHPEHLSAAVWSCFSNHSADVREVSQGETIAIGDLILNVLHPDRGTHYAHTNDESLVIKITSQHEEGTLLVCGDAEEDALKAVLHAYPHIQCDVLELPHHGSWNSVAAEFVRRSNPYAIIQSTGSRRFRRDRWKTVLEHRDRYVTCRDGASVVELSDVLLARKNEVPPGIHTHHREQAGTTPP